MRKDALTPSPVDFSEWLAQLDQNLTLAGEGYLKRKVDEPDAELMRDTWPPVRSNRTSFAMLALGMVNNALSQLPGMRGHVGLVPLHDLTAALIDLGQGGKPALLQPMQGVGTGNELTADRWVRQHSLLFVAMLETIGIKAGRACEIVAGILADNGHVGRKRDSETGLPRPLSAKTVAHWRSEARKRDFAKCDPRMAEFIDRNLDCVRGRSDWPLDESALVSLISSMAKNKLLTSKI